jgi:hypothetical protein
MRLLLLFLSSFLLADNEIFIDQSGANATIKLEQLGSTNLIGGTSSVAGSMTAFSLVGTDMTLTINQIGSSNIFRSDGFNSDYVEALFDFDGDSNQMDILMNSGGAYSADYANYNVQVTGGSNTFDIEIAENSNADYLDLDWIIDGDSNEFEFDIDYENSTNYIDLFGDSNTITFAGSGYSGTTASDSGYLYMDITGSSNTFDITQASTLARDWLKITGNGSNSSWCIVQNDDGSTATSC